MYIATKTPAQDGDGLKRDLETSLKKLRTDHVDIYQFHNPAFCPKPGDGTGLYEAMEEAKAQGMVRHIGITNHRLAVPTRPLIPVSMRRCSSPSAIWQTLRTSSWWKSAGRRTWALSL